MIIYSLKLSPHESNRYRGKQHCFSGCRGFGVATAKAKCLSPADPWHSCAKAFSTFLKSYARVACLLLEGLLV